MFSVPCFELQWLSLSSAQTHGRALTRRGLSRLMRAVAGSHLTLLKSDGNWRVVFQIWVRLALSLKHLWRILWGSGKGSVLGVTVVFEMPAFFCFSLLVFLFLHKSVSLFQFVGVEHLWSSSWVPAVGTWIIPKKCITVKSSLKYKAIFRSKVREEKTVTT